MACDISVAQLRPAIKEGWLTKQGGRIKTWKKRWFVLKPDTLYYFVAPESERPKGYIPLQGDKGDIAVSDVFPTKPPKPHSFFINCSGGKRNTFVIAAENEQEKDSWKEAIINRKKSTSPSPYTSSSSSSQTSPSPTSAVVSSPTTPSSTTPPTTIRSTPAVEQNPSTQSASQTTQQTPSSQSTDGHPMHPTYAKMPAIGSLIPLNPQSGPIPTLFASTPLSAPTTPPSPTTISSPPPSSPSSSSTSEHSTYDTLPPPGSLKPQTETQPQPQEQEHYYETLPPSRAQLQAMQYSTPQPPQKDVLNNGDNSIVFSEMAKEKNYIGIPPEDPSSSNSNTQQEQSGVQHDAQENMYQMLPPSRLQQQGQSHIATIPKSLLHPSDEPHIMHDTYCELPPPKKRVDL